MKRIFIPKDRTLRIHVLVEAHDVRGRLRLACPYPRAEGRERRVTERLAVQLVTCQRCRRRLQLDVELAWLRKQVERIERELYDQVELAS